jgi:predicted HicB family RNase H-like nuclease
MRGKVKLHNLGTGFFGDQFEDIHKGFQQRLKELEESQREALANAGAELSDSIARLEGRVNEDIRSAIVEIGESHERDLAILERKMDGAVSRGYLDVLGKLNAHEDTTHAWRVQEVSRRNAFSNFLLLRQHEDKADVIRQGVYLIELVRELLGDVEPKFVTKERWYDHGWR